MDGLRLLLAQHPDYVSTYLGKSVKRPGPLEEYVAACDRLNAYVVPGILDLSLARRPRPTAFPVR